MQQHLMQTQPMVAAYYPNSVTTDHIQQQQQQAVHSQVGLSSGILQSEASSAGGSGSLGARGFPDFVRVSSVEGMHGGGRAMAGGSKQDSGSAVGSPEDQCDDEN
ncbi:hypothetical protein V6N13_136481 [Hibiscus sabdariffa]